MEFSKLFLAASFGLLLSVSVLADPRDPTKPSYPTENNLPAAKHNGPLVLSAIWISGKSKRAMINGVSGKQGQTILNGVRLVKIRHNSVTVQIHGELETLQLIHSYQNQANTKQGAH